MHDVRKSILALTLGFSLVTICRAKTASTQPTTATDGGFTMPSTDTPSRNQAIEAAKGVFLFPSPDFDGIEVDGNSIAIVCDHDILVFDTNVLPSSAARVLDEIREISDKPVRYVVNSHWHPDHWDGNEVYAKRFPDLEIISSTDTRRLMENSMHIYGKTIEKLSAGPAKEM